MSLVSELQGELGEEPKPKRGTNRSTGSGDIWELAAGVETTRVLDRLGIEYGEKFAVCPGCGEDGALLCENGGIKCLHDRCGAVGPANFRGFRSNVDLVVHAKSVKDHEAAKLICEWFGIPIPETASSAREQVETEYVPGLDDDPMREPGADEDETPQKPAPIQSDTGRVFTVHELLTQSADRALNRVRVDTCTTGHWRLDDSTGGFKKGFVWVMGADTSFGKSSWLVQVADENIKRGKTVLIVSGEDDEALYGDRILVRRAGVEYKSYRRGRLDREEEARVREVARRAELVPVFLDGRGRSIEKLCKQIDSLIKAHNVDLVALDYVQAFDNDRKQQDKRNQITYIARKFTDVVKSNGRAGLILSQITKSEQKRNPDKHSIRDSRDVSNAAEVVCLGFEPEKAIMDGSQILAASGQKVLLLDKCKDGPRGGIYPLMWSPITASFGNVTDPEAERIERMIGTTDGSAMFEDRS